MNGRGSELEAALHATRDRMLGLLLEVGHTMEQARAIGSRVQAHVQADEMFTGGIAEALRAAQAFASTCGWLIQQLGMAEVAPDASLLTDRYTMQSERRIHAQAAAKQGPSGTAAKVERWGREEPPGAAPDSAASDDLGDNVELF